MQTVAIFVDVQNIYYTVKDAFHRHFNYQSFWEQATQGRQVIAAYAYAIDKGDARQQAFQNILRQIGFEVKLKPFIQRTDGSAKGDWDVGITLDVMDLSDQADVVILLSGDGDFAILLDKLHSRHEITTEVYGVKQLTAPALVNAASRFYEIDKDLLI